MPTSAENMALYERDRQIAALRAKIDTLNNELEAAKAQQDGNVATTPKRRQIQMSPHAFHIQQEHNQANSHRPVLRAKPQRMGRNASISTQTVMASLPATDNGYASHPLPMRILDMFQNPSAHLDYLNSEQFAKDVFKLCQKVRHMLEKEPRVVFLQSPAYIFGDIHGNLEDLHFFSDNIWRLGMSLTAGNFLFLGDYVDRGLSCLEVTAYLLSMKLQLPNKVFLLRGNHETRDVNGWEEHYAERSFIYQCRSRFGDEIGYRLWEACNQVFDRLPLAAVVDQDIFCVHGGIPRPIHSNTTRIQDILAVPKVAGINPPYEHEPDNYQQVASDCIWSDPASEEQELHSVDPNTGFGESLRGGGAICFGSKAVSDFLQQQGFSYIMRAHEAHAEGVAVSKGARVFTVFSTSKDHNQGSQALAGCILVDGDKLQVINRSPAYKNQYVHRRGSISVASLPPAEMAKRIQLGLVTQDPNHSDSEDEEWNDIDSSEDSEQDNESTSYVFAQNRRASIDLQSMAQNFHDSTVSSGSMDPIGLGISNSSLQNGTDGDGDSYMGGGSNHSGSLGGSVGSIHKRHRASIPSRSTSLQSVTENKMENEEDDDETSTVDGDADVDLGGR